MRVIIFGATGMVGQGVLRECLLSPEVDAILSVGRSATSMQHEKLQELIHKDMINLSAIADCLVGYDACFFCLGVSSAGMTEKDYYYVTYEITLAVAQTLARLNPDMTFIYVSGAGTDSTEQGRTRWARVKGKTENDLLSLPFKAVYMFRPGYIQPLNGIKSKTKMYRAMYTLAAPLYPLWKALAPNHVTTTEKVGQAMINAARQGAAKTLLDNKDINELCQ